MKRDVFLLFMAVLIVCFILIPGNEAWAQKTESETREDEPISLDTNTMVGLTIGNYRVASDRYKQIFGPSRAIIGMEASHVFSLGDRSLLGLSLEVRGFSKSGQSTETGILANFSMTPITLTGKYMLEKGDFHPYLGTGLDYILYKETSSMGDSSGGRTGFHVEAGVYYQPPLFDFIKIRAVLRYSRAVAEVNDIKVNLGGLEFGIGILYGFRV